MCASCSESWAGTAPRALRLWLTLGLIWFVSLVSTSAAPAATTSKSTAPADTGGFSVRVREEGRTTLPPSARRAIERAKQEAEAKAGRIPTPPTPPTPGIPHEPNMDEGDDYVRFGEDITIPEGKTIDGDVVAIGGDVTVYGHVTGDCVSVGGTVQVRGKGVVDGDVVAMGGGVNTTDSGSVGGSNVSLGSFPFKHSDRFWPMVWCFGAVGTGIWVFMTIIRLALTLFFAWLALLLAKERMTYAVESMYQAFGRSFLWGLAGLGIAIMVVPTATIVIILVGAIAVAILAITIIGIPVAILLLIAMVLAIVGMVLALLLAMFLGYLNGAMFLGQRILGRPASAPGRPLVAILIGASLLAALHVASRLIGLVGVLVFHPIAIALGIAAGALVVILTIAGFGAMIMTRFARGPRGEGAVGAQWWPPSRPRAGAERPVEPQPSAAGPAGPAPPEGGSSDAP